MDKMMTSSERFLRTTNCVSLLKFCWLSTHIHIYTMREMRISF
jgi:hypothetical protein